MAPSRLSALVLILSLLSFLTLSTASGSCSPSPVKPKPTPKPKPKPLPPPKKEYCPLTYARLRSCVELLGLVNVIIGQTTPSGGECCAVVAGLADAEAAYCFCTVINANIMGTKLTVPVALNFLVSGCLRTLPPGFECPK